MTKNSKKSLIARPLRKSTSQSKSSLAQRSISAASHKNKVSDELLGQLQHAGQLEVANQLQEADSVYQAITTKSPSFATAWHSWGLLDVARNNLPLAAEKIARAVVLDQNQSLFHRNLGEVCRRIGQLEQAVISGKKACELAPKDVDALHNLGLAYLDVHDYKNASQIYRRLLKLNPLHGLAWNNLGAALEKIGEINEAFKAYTKAVELNPQHAEAQNNLGAIYYENGSLKEAKTHFDKAIEAKPDFVMAHYNVSSLKTYTKEDPQLAVLNALLPQESTLDTVTRSRLHFAMGKALEDIQEFDRSFASYQFANQLQRELLPYDEARADAVVERTISTFDSEFFKGRADWRGNQKSPIFIVGMPRSGTSLLEQILATHSSVYGAGELTVLSEVIAKAAEGLENPPFTEAAKHFSEKELLKIANDYAKRVWDLSSSSEFITDKMPANFFYLGLIYLLFPNAKVINMQRDPMDSCFSCFARMFNDTMEFAYDMGSIGRYYVQYRRLMEHWKKVLPTNFVLDVHYEDLVENTEAEAKRITEFIGLPWQDKCLDFHTNTRQVKTASKAQVVKPIYKTSLARWKHFAPHLGGLYAMVKPYCHESISETIFEKNPQSPALPNFQHNALEFAAKQVIDRCVALQGNNDHQGAIRLLSENLGLVNQSPVLLHLLGISYYRLDQFPEAIQAYEHGLAMQPQFSGLLNSYGFVLQDVGRMHDALKAFETAVEISPDLSIARLNLGLAQLKLGDLENGWENYEARWTGSAESANSDFKRPEVPRPQWDGQLGTENQTLLVVTEQGFGDTFQFSRFLLMASKRFAKVGFACSQPTQRLMEWALGNNIVLMTKLPTDYAVWDWFCPLMSLPRALKIRVENIPTPEPYLKPLPQAQDYWAKRLDAAAPGRFRVGIAWTGRKSHQYDSRRSIRFELLHELLNTPNITWVSLQKWGAEEMAPHIPPSVDWIDWTPDLVDFADTSALLANLDLIISVDSSLVHLSGMMGKPVWMMNRFDCEWRWLMNRNDSPWYPTIKIFNQPQFGDWHTVIKSVQQELSALPVPQVPAKPRGPGVASSEGVLTGNLVYHSEGEALQLANQLQSAGRILEAEKLLQEVIKANPAQSQALHLLGVIAYQLGRADEGLEWVQKAIATNPNDAHFYSNLAEMLRQKGRIDEAVLAGERSVELDPMLASAHSNLGVALYDANQLDRAQAEQLQALSLDANLLQSLNNLGSIERARKNRIGAIEWYQKALAINANFIQSLSNLGAVLVESDRADEAVPLLERGLGLQPNSPELLGNLGLAYFKQDKYDEAKVLLEKSLELKPNYPIALTGLAAVLGEAEQYEVAENLLNQALAIEPDKLDAYCQLGTIYLEQGKTPQAKFAFQEALKLDPSSTDALVGLGNIQLEEGQIDDAAITLKKAIAIDSNKIDARFHLSQVKKVKAGDENLLALEGILAKGEKLSANSRISLYYALGKCYDDIGEFEKAFTNFEKGASLKRTKLSYDAGSEEAFTNAIIQTLDANTFNRLTGSGDHSTTPIFVLGMPRSGTTLTEQIIASHPSVFGAGELDDLAIVAQHSKIAKAHGNFPENILQYSPEELTGLGQEYLDRLRAHAPDAKFITDKMPSNYILMGLIPLILPNAKIVHVKRNALDTCLSCYTRLFNKHQDASYDLSELGRSYKNYRRLVEHWKQILPSDAFYEVNYEDLVDDIEGQSKALIRYCGLEWDPACLEFYENKRNIRTASVSQVRQPIYKSSVERWRNYEGHLQALITEIKEYL
ncbi:tetratricopeptide (TPR) repeat protein [Polynucleobacter sphagniphilus]|uniref:Tetratricopeptide (TPR) repeat protein n=1 Tax=Polynucleobacter sphagniphilus TaxID=1743169 RepID=A0AA43MBC9_9BURK|nr:tetratricopeptide (TPR) repeat protein [Polynucleobacter sphagniphilus]MDH6513486.1 tetratricopeptide (TPR) repeat protein [Polynucleobacter sphagniphilus]